ncbi:MAG: (d)CMP kinase [Actinomycetota bacterium]
MVAIDGPAGAGKSTVSRGLAARLGIGYLDTGAMYRAVTLLARRGGVPPADGAALAALAERHDIRLVADPAGLRVLVDGEDVSDAIRTPDVTAAVSDVAAQPEVRRALVARQRAILHDGDWVADGRDIGTVVAPDAEVKVFLTADPRVRAERRLGDLRAAGRAAPVEEVLVDIERRDLIDSTRADSPLRPAPGAVELDTTGMGVDEVVEAIAALVARRRAGGRA